MRIRIYQMDPVRGGKEALDLVKHDPADIDITKYNRVFVGDIDCKSCEKILAMFGQNRRRHPASFHGHELTTNDIIEIAWNSGNALYQVESKRDNTSFMHELDPELEIDLTKATDAVQALIGVLVSPGKYAQVIHLPLNDRTRDQLFGQKYQILAFPDGTHAICREDALKAQPYSNELNRILRQDKSDIHGYAIIQGPMFFCNVGNDLNSLLPAECRSIYEKYRYPERFYTHNNQLCSMQYLPEFGGR